MSHVIETIPVTPTSRLVVMVDESPENPRTLQYQMTGALTLAGDTGRADVTELYSFPGDLWKAYDSLWRYSSRRGYWEPSPVSVLRWARIFYPTIRLDYVDGTFWWVDPEQMAANWPDLTPGTHEYRAKEAAVIEADRLEYQRWADGEVYGVTLERLTTYRPVNPDGSVDSTDQYDMEQWDEVESVWGCYLDDTYDAQSVARENFSLTDEEADALEPTKS